MDLDRTAFTLDGEEVTIGDAIAASWIAAWTRPLEARLREDLARSALAHERGVEVGSDELQARLDAWRLERDLAAADELEEWLSERGLDLDDVVSHLERVVLRRTRGSETELARCAPSPADVLELLPADMEVAADMTPLVHRFALRSVAPEPAEDREGDRRRIVREMLSERDADLVDDLAEQCDALGVTPHRMEELLAIETRFRLYQADVLSLGRLQAALEESREHLVRYDLATAACPTEDVAREIICCIRIDGDALPRSAARASLAWRRDVAYLSDLASLPFGERVATLPRMGLLGPDLIEGRLVVGQLMDRAEPDLSAPEVVDRVRDRLLERVLRVPLSARVRFPVPARA
jgi:hypothetical protein